MKKLFYILFAFTLFVSCSDSDDDNSQDYTSFVIWHNEEVTLTNCITAYKKDNIYYKLGELGDLSKGKKSPEITINDKSIKAIYLFSDYPNPSILSDTIFVIRENIKNIFELSRYTKGIPVTDKTDPTQYPQ